MKIYCYDSRIDSFVETSSRTGHYPFMVGEPVSLRIGDVITANGLAGKEGVAKKHLPEGCKWVPCDNNGTAGVHPEKHGVLYVIV